MAAYSLRKLDGEPIILFSRNPGEWQPDEMVTSVTETIALLDRQTGPVFLVLDLPGLSLDLSDSLAASSMTTRGDNPLLHHPRLRETVFVTTDPMLQHSVRSMAASPTFGFARVSHVETAEEALDYCRLRLVETNGSVKQGPSGPARTA
jgi:hypothetical protein